MRLTVGVSGVEGRLLHAIDEVIVAGTSAATAKVLTDESVDVGQLLDDGFSVACRHHVADDFDG